MLLIAIFITPFQSFSSMYLTKEFGVPAAVGSLAVSYIEAGVTVKVLISLLVGVGSGGLGLIANAGKMALTQYLKQELKKRGKKAFIAW